MGNPLWTTSDWVWGPFDPAAQSERRPLLARVEHTFHHKRKRGRPVGKRELAEKHYSSAVRTFYVAGGNPRLDIVLNIPHQRPLPNLPSHMNHYHRDWKGQRHWLYEETYYAPEDLQCDLATGSATYSVNKSPKRGGTWY
ncbi:hypothetical protein PG984_008307 [Apiospora sp. TS-2023a]